MKQATLVFLIKDRSILLAMKKRGFGVGLWNGAGGKPEPQESIKDAAIRECQEEINVTPVSMKEVATINFYFDEAKKSWNQQVMVFLCDQWTGEPSESEEMAPKWFQIEKIPYKKMWEDDVYWLPKILKGEYVMADFHFDEFEKLLSHKFY